jgi:hypothetical protein
LNLPRNSMDDPVRDMAETSNIQHRTSNIEEGTGRVWV